MNLQLKPLNMREAVDYHFMSNKGGSLLYKGFLGALMRSTIFCTVRFEIYELARRHNLLSTFPRRAIAASLSGCIGGFMSTPVTRAYVRMQNDDLFAPNERRYYKSVGKALYSSYREEGIRMMFAGSMVSSLRGMMGTIGQLALYDEVKEMLQLYPDYFPNNFSTYLVASVAAGFSAAVLQQPFDVVNINLMHAHAGKYKNTMDVVRKTYRLYGIKGFYRGLVPSFTRLIIHTLVTYAILENLQAQYATMLKTRREQEAEDFKGFEVITMDDINQEKK